MRWILASVVLFTLAPVGFADIESVGPSTGPKESSSPEFANLEYRLIGPFCGGRVSRVAGIPGDPLTYYAATAAGGVWKSNDGGISFQSIFDDQPVSSIGSIAVAPSDPNVVYVGSGEANIRGNVAAGNGIYKSTDAGKTWKHVWKQIGQIGTMAVHPTNPDIAFAAVLGHAFGPNADRGVYRTLDGGKTWQRVLFASADAGASDVVIDPNNPRIIYAGMWQTRRKPWELTSGGPGSGLHVSRDGGDTWVSLKKDAPDNGLPQGEWGKVGIAIAPSDSRRIYALIEATEGGLFRSDDGGEKWERINGDHILRQRAWYFSTITVDPTNRDIVIVPQVPLLKSTDGGKTFRRLKGTHHVDHHDCWIDPRNPRRMIVANDGGVDITTNGGEKWYAPPMPIAQFYHLSCDNRKPYHVLGCMQDQGTACGPSHSLSSAGILQSHWFKVGGGEAGYAVADPTDPDIVYAGEYGGYISRYDHKTRTARNITAYPFNPSGYGARDLKYRFQWTAPILISKFDPKTVYHAANVLFRTRNGGQSWEAVSPDLTRNDKNKQNWSGGPITGDNTGVEIYDTIFALAEGGTVEKPILWAGSDDGLVHLSRDGGKTWDNVTANFPDLPDWGTVKCIETSPHDPATAYVVVDAHRLDDYRPHLWKTTDLGKTWKRITAGLPNDVYVHVVREDPKQKGLLFLGSERGILCSHDAGQSWKPLKLNMPTVAIHDLIVKNDDLVVGTNGRSAWILDDITPIREWSNRIAEKPFHLFVPRVTTRWHLHGEVSDHMERLGNGDNPEDGVVISYAFKSEPKKPFRIEVYNVANQKVAGFASDEKTPKPDETLADGPDLAPSRPELAAKVGVNRFVWDMRHEGAKIIDKAKVDWGDPTEGPLVAPGCYTVKLIVDGQTQSVPFRIEGDPRFQKRASLENLKPGLELLPAPHIIADDQEAFQLRLRDNITKLSGIVKNVRTIRKQLDLRNEVLAEEDGPDAAALRKRSSALIEKLDALEAKLHNPKAKVSYDILAQRGGAKLYSQLVSMLEFAREGEGPPPRGLLDLTKEFENELTRYANEFDGLVQKDLATLNDLARQKGFPTVWGPRKK